MKTSLNPNIEFLKIINLIKNKHLKIERDDLSKIKSSFANELISIKNNKRIINIKIKKNFFLINSIIKNQEDEIQLLHQEKKILNHNKIQSNIIYSQKILIDNFKQSIEELKFNLYQLEKKLKEILIK